MSQINNSSDALIDLRVGCLNANGLGDKTKRNLVLNWLKNKNETIIFLQESHSTPETERLWKLDWGGDIVFNHGTFNSTGIAVLFNQSIVGDIKIQNTVHITSGADPCSTLGGIIPHFYRFFGILKFWGDIQVLPIFQVLTILKIWGYIQVLTKMYLNN